MIMRVPTLAGALLAATSPAVAKEPVRFSVTVVGNGPDVILVPGLASSVDVWNATRDQLKGKYRLHLIQVGGFAGPPVRAPVDQDVIAPLVEELDAYIKDKKLKKPAIIGHSLGGASAMMLAARHPADVGRILVVDSLPFYSMIFNPLVTVEEARPFADNFRNTIVHQPQPEFENGQEKAMARLIKTESYRPVAAGWSLKSDRSTMATAVYELMTTDLRGEIGKIVAPMTIVYAYDTAMGPQANLDTLWAGAYSNAPKAKLTRVDDSLHFIMIDQPARFAQEVSAFLGEKPKP
jgi:pimeloyl-[acyl-carrier protein] methyl ester esterase